jgi:hypothetical protein
MQGHFNYVEVLIEPLHEGMNLVQVHAKSGLEDMIQTTPIFVSDSCLSVLVRQKALQANVSGVLMSMWTIIRDPNSLSETCMDT